MIKIIKKILGIINSIVLCFRFPFLYPRNRFSGKHEVYIPWIMKLHNWTYENIIQPVCFIPTYTELDAMPKGWRKCFGIQMCKEIKASLKRHNCLKEYRITQIKEKFGGLRWYNAAAPEEVYKIIQKYEYI